jgi:hypothetical protein
MHVRDSQGPLLPAAMRRHGTTTETQRSGWGDRHARRTRAMERLMEREQRRPRVEEQDNGGEFSVAASRAEQGVMVAGVRHGGVVGKIGPCRTKCSAELKVGKATGCGRSCYARPRRCSARAAARVLEDSQQVQMRHDVQGAP